MTISTLTFTDLYTEVQQFYAKQIHHLDGNEVDEFTATFTEDGEFSHTPDEIPARGRANIAAAVHHFNKRFVNDPVVRRHWFNMLTVEPQHDGTIRTIFYALVVTTRPGGQPVIAPSCVAHDVLIRQDGRLLTRSRRVEHDELR
jgi:actinorhodin biosynthesis protein ActVIA